MKTTSTLILSITFLLLMVCNSTVLAQNEYMDYKIRDTVPDADFTIFNMNDFRDALVQLGINVYKWNLPIPKDKDYKLKFYVQEYEKGKLVKDSTVGMQSTKFWGFNSDGLAEFQYLKNIRLITTMPDFNDKTSKLRIRISLNSNKFQLSQNILPRAEYGLYYLRKFEEIEFELEKNMPLLLFTAGWETNVEGKLVRQFCGPNYSPADLKDQSFNDSDHYFVFGYRVVDEEFYGRD